MKIFFYLALVFYFPLFLLSFIYYSISKILLNSSKKHYGYLAGYRAKIGLWFLKHSFYEFKESLLETVAFATQLSKEKIMKAIDAKKAYPFIVRSERKKPPEEQTVFLCKFIDPYTAAELGDQIYNVSGVGSNRKEKLLTGTQQFEILKKFVVGWENMRDENDQQVLFDNKKIIDMISMIPPRYRSEIAEFIRGESDLEEGEEQS